VALTAPAPEGERASNVVLWAVAALVALSVGGYFLAGVYRHLDADLALGAAALAVRTVLYVSGGLALEGVLLRAGARNPAPSRPRRVALHVAWIGVMLLCVALVVDALVFAFAGYHLATAVRILFSDGPAGVGEVVEATGLSPRLVLGAAAGVAVGLAGATWLSRRVRRLSGRLNRVVSRRAAVRALFVSLGVLAVVEMVSLRVRNPFLWEREVRSVPLAFSIVRPEAELASFRVAARRPPPARARAAAVRLPDAPPAALPDVFLVIVESLRKDAVTPEIMPRLAGFAAGSWTFEHPITTGNVTHYSWYGLLCGEPPAFFEAVKGAPEEQGSATLSALRRLGYRVELYATPDTAYQGLESLVFGRGGALLDRKFHPSAALPADRDQAVIEEVARTVAGRRPGGTVYVIALDSSHFDYSWGAGFRPPFTPFAADASIARNYQVDARARRALVNRYHDAVAWVDGLLGRLLDALGAAGRLERSYLVVTGDHGEAFWEHGTGTHGTALDREQVEVGFAMRLPGRSPRRFDAVLSLLDVLPTVLHDLGVEAGEGGAAAWAGVPVQRRYPAGSPPSDGAHHPDPAPGPLAPRAALTFRGWNERTFRFALTRGDERLLFSLDRPDPLAARRLSLQGVTDLSDVSLVSGDGRDVAGTYERVLRELPAVLDELPFLAP
jgi:uncharacterized protein